MRQNYTGLGLFLTDAVVGVFLVEFDYLVEDRWADDCCDISSNRRWMFYSIHLYFHQKFLKRRVWMYKNVCAQNLGVEETNAF